MSIKDKTREKLVESMRKTKTTVTAEPAQQAPAATRSAQADKPAPKRTQTVSHGGDNYQSSGRVWPD